MIEGGTGRIADRRPALLVLKRHANHAVTMPWGSIEDVWRIKGELLHKAEGVRRHLKTSSLFFKSGFYHVIMRGNQGQAIFSTRADNLRFLEFLGRDLERRSMALYAYCLMPNHVHLLLEQYGDFSLSRVLRRLTAAYTHHFNRAHRKSGNLFQRPHQVILVEKGKYLSELVRYVILHPIRSRITKKAGQYRWTSYLPYLRKGVRSPVHIAIEPVLRQFGEDPRKARKAFGEFLKKGLKEGHRADYYDLRDGYILGRPWPGETQAHPALAPGPRLRMDLGDIWKALLKRESLDREPGGRKRSDLVSEAAYLAVRFCGIQQKDVGKHFDLGQSGVSRALGRLEEHWLAEPGAKEKWMEWVRSLEEK